jgi:predicted  nucleic acid-binding Zn-ribbon protein
MALPRSTNKTSQVSISIVTTSRRNQPNWLKLAGNYERITRFGNTSSKKLENLNMSQRSVRSKIVPKISTMPRQQTEATVYLDVYKLVVERKRLQQEQQKIEQRSQQIGQRLAQLDQQITSLEATLQQMRSEALPEARSEAPPLPSQTPATQPDAFDMLFLEY